MAHLFSLSQSHEIILTGPHGLKNLEEMSGEINHNFLPHSVVLAADSSLEKAAPFIKNYAPINNMPTAYVCHNFSCQAPTNDINELLKHIAD